MIGRPVVVRRRPLLRAAAIGGTFAAGRASGRRAGEQASAQDQQQGAAQQAAPQQPPPGNAGPQPSAADQLAQLTTLHQQGSLTDDEFAAAKAQVLGG